VGYALNNNTGDRDMIRKHETDGSIVLLTAGSKEGQKKGGREPGPGIRRIGKNSSRGGVEKINLAYLNSPGCWSSWMKEQRQERNSRAANGEEGSGQDGKDVVLTHGRLPLSYIRRRKGTRRLILQRENTATSDLR